MCVCQCLIDFLIFDLFFFFKQKTAYEMRMSDWSSDVCSSDLSLLLQMQGMIAEYERAKIMERNRRGKLHGARRGSINVLSTAPYGYRYIRKQLDGAPADRKSTRLNSSH